MQPTWTEEDLREHILTSETEELLEQTRGDFRAVVQELSRCTQPIPFMVLAGRVFGNAPKTVAASRLNAVLRRYPRNVVRYHYNPMVPNAYLVGLHRHLAQHVGQQVNQFIEAKEQDAHPDPK